MKKPKFLSKSSSASNIQQNKNIALFDQNNIENIIQNNIENNIEKLEFDPNGLAKKILRINEDINRINIEDLMSEIDPTFNSAETLAQIQKYYYGIKNEIRKFFSKEEKQRLIKSQIEEINQLISDITKPKKEEIEEDNVRKYSNDSKKVIYKKENKPFIDYKVKIRSLTKEIEHIYHKYNLVTFRNRRTIEELEEMRKHSKYRTSLLEEQRTNLKKFEEKYISDKLSIENAAERKEQKRILEEILKKEKELRKINKEMASEVQENDEEFMHKKAEDRSLDFRTEKLIKETEELEKERKKKFAQLDKEIKPELDMINNFKDSEILKILDNDKMKEFERILNNLLKQTKTETSVGFIENLISTCGEVDKFKNEVETVQKNVQKLDKENEILEHIVNFCESNLSVNRNNKLGEEEKKFVNDLNQAGSILVNLQYQVVNTIFNDFLNRLIVIANNYYSENNEEEEKIGYELSKSEQLKMYNHFLMKIESRYKKLAQKLKCFNKNSKDIFDFSKWNSKFDKMHLVAEMVRKNYEANLGKGLKFESKQIKNLVNDIIIKENKE